MLSNAHVVPCAATLAPQSQKCEHVQFDTHVHDMIVVEKPDYNSR